MNEHTLTMAVRQHSIGREFRAECSCGWVSIWRTTNACMGNGRRHVAAMRRKVSR